MVLFMATSISANVVRKKRFFSTLWPSEEIKSDVKNGFIYANLPPEYLPLLPGVNDHKIERRTGQHSTRFVHPTRMMLLLSPQQQPKTAAAASKVPPQVSNKASDVAQLNQEQVPRIVMKPIAPNPKLSPSLTLKTKEQALPDIHKTYRFIPIRPLHNATQKPLIQPFSTQQQLPIKKSLDTSAPQLSIKTASIKEFYHTKEFQDLLDGYKIGVDISKLPPIEDVMAILGTENPEETMNAIRDVTKSAEGMELIKSYLDQNNVDDEFYNYDEDNGAGEIKVGSSEDVKFVQPPQPSFESTFQLSQAPAQTPIRASTTGTLTGSGQTWWKPTTWFSSSPSTKVDSLQKDIEIMKNVIPKPTSAWDNLNYIGNFLAPTSSESVPINPPLNVQSFPRRIFHQQPLKFSHQSVIEDIQTLPVVRMSEAQFQDMVKTLRLQEVNTQPINMPSVNTQSIQTIQSTNSPKDQADKDMLVTTTLAPNAKFQAPIIVQSISTGISQQSLPLPSTYTQFDEPQPREPQTSLELPNEAANQENRRNFVSPSEPQRSAPYDFIAAGKIHKANPEEVFKKSRSLADIIEGRQL